MKPKPTSQEFYDSIEDKESFYWRSSGIHTYNVLLKMEEQEKKDKPKLKQNNSKLKEWVK